MIGFPALLFLIWPIVLTLAALLVWHNKLNRRWVFVSLGVLGCIVVELILANGLLLVVAGPGVFGLVARLIAGYALLYALYRYDQRHPL